MRGGRDAQLGQVDKVADMIDDARFGAVACGAAGADKGVDARRWRASPSPFASSPLFVAIFSFASNSSKRARLRRAFTAPLSTPRPPAPPPPPPLSPFFLFPHALTGRASRCALLSLRGACARLRRALAPLPSLPPLSPFPFISFFSPVLHLSTWPPAKPSLHLPQPPLLRMPLRPRAINAIKHDYIKNSNRRYKFPS
jgi:hypothetical protein